MKTQKEMFWDSHRHVANETAKKALDLARQKRFAAVQAWRDAGADESQFEAFTAEADKAVDIAESFFIA